MTKSERALYALLRTKYDEQRYALIPQVPDATGLNQSRTADAIAMGLWPSRGLILEGFEFKASRSDWLAELKNPAKAESIMRYCHRWWIVVSDAAIVKPGELPSTWGLLVPSRGTLAVKTRAPALEPHPVDYTFLAGLLRAAQKNSAEKAAVEAAHAAGVKEGEDRSKNRADVVKGDLRQLRKDVQDFERESGVKIGYWQGEQIGKDFALFMDRHRRAISLERQLERLQERAHQIAEEIDKALAD